MSKKNRKFLATTVTAAAVAAVLAPSVSADELKFTDVSDTYADAVNFLVGNGITKGVEDTKFGTHQNITRVDAAVLVARALGFDENGKYKDAGFTDVPDRAKWAVNALVQNNVVDGLSTTKFGSYDNLTRGQTAKLLANAAKLPVNDGVTKTKFTDVNENFAKYVDALVREGVTKGKEETKFGANDAVKRGELALFLDRAKEHFGFFDLFVMHTNDTHAKADMGPKRATAVKELRSEHKNNLLVDAGDVFSGTLYFNEFQGAADLQMMNYMGYDAMTFGNHEFDLGSSEEGHKALASFVKNAKFPMLSANLDFSKDELFIGLQNNRYTSDYSNGIYDGIVVDVNGEEVGIFGLTTEETPTISSTGEVQFANYVEKAKEAVAAFEARGVDKIIALTHLGYNDSLNFDNDLELAKKVEGIDIIVGGHTHSELKDPVVSNEFDAPTIIVQAGTQSKYLGTLNAVFNEDGVVTSFGGELVKVGDFEADAKAEEILAPYKKKVDELMNQSTGVSTEVALDGGRDSNNEGNSSVRHNETNLGNLITDGMLATAKTINDKTTIAMQNGGGIRASIDEGDITVGEVMTVLPFGNALAIMELKGSEIKAALEHSVSADLRDDKTGLKESGAFLHVSGLKFEYDSSKPAGERVTKVEVSEGDKFVALDDAKTYFVATNTFTAAGGDGYDMFGKAYADGRVSEPGNVDYQMFIDYLNVLDKVAPAVEGRIVDVNPAAAKTVAE
ncbi:5'-nucleotidase C-terminal domain-containing protein [Chungangia koreensis]|uniref:5'-nucleotidase C-terminal domain-containing protein n=1 Tax=Chungangia koreensis TaxID=752657 RepID=A0ABV8X578_9LACT